MVEEDVRACVDWPRTCEGMDVTEPAGENVGFLLCSVSRFEVGDAKISDLGRPPNRWLGGDIGLGDGDREVLLNGFWRLKEPFDVASVMMWRWDALMLSRRAKTVTRVENKLVVRT